MRWRAWAICVVLALAQPQLAGAQSAIAALLAAPIEADALPDLVPAAFDGVLLAGRPVVPERQVLALLPRSGTALTPVSAATPLTPRAMPTLPLPPLTGTAQRLDPKASDAVLPPVKPVILAPRLPDPADADDRALLESVLGPDALTDALPPSLTGKELARAVQTELTRVGCYDRAIDGDFGRGSNGALDLFFATTKLSRATPELTEAVLEQIIAAPARVCEKPYSVPAVATGNSGGSTRNSASGSGSSGGSGSGSRQQQPAPEATPSQKTAPQPKAPATIDPGIYGG